MRTSCELNDTFRLSDVLSTPKPPVASVFLKNTQTAYWSLCENIKPHVVVSLPPSNPLSPIPSKRQLGPLLGQLEDAKPRQRRGLPRVAVKEPKLRRVGFGWKVFFC